MAEKKVTLSSEAMGGRRFKYGANVCRQPDGTFVLTVSSIGPPIHRCMPEGGSFTTSELADLKEQSEEFLKAWGDSQPEAKDHVLCCTKVVQNALAQARKKLENPAGLTDARRMGGR